MESYQRARMLHVDASTLMEFRPGGQKHKCLAVTDAGQFVIKVDARSQAPAPNNKAFANELLASAIARRIGVCTVDCAIVRLAKSHVIGGIRFDADIYFGSCHSPWPALFDGARVAHGSNRFDDKALHRLFALDVLLMNPDRKGSDVLIHRGAALDNFKAIDFANSLTGENWTADHLSRNHSGNAGQVSNWWFWEFGENGSGKTAAHDIQIKCGDFEEIVASVAADWGLSSGDEAAVLSFLAARGHRLPELVESQIETALRPSR